MFHIRPLPYLLLSFGAVAFLAPLSVSAATLTAASCNQTDVLAAINLAVDGDTVRVPAGTCTWSSTIAITKSLAVTGAGTSSTIIIDGNPQSSSPLSVNLSGTQNVNVSGFQFQRINTPDHYSPIIGFNTTGTALAVFMITCSLISAGDQ